MSGFIDIALQIGFFIFNCTLFYEVVVATSAIICKKGFAPHTGARAIPPSSVK